MDEIKVTLSKLNELNDRIVKLNEQGDRLGVIALLYIISDYAEKLKYAAVDEVLVQDDFMKENNNE